MRLSYAVQTVGLQVGGVRLRCVEPAKVLRRRGHEVYIGPNPKPRGVTVITKYMREDADYVRMKIDARMALVLDINDDNFHIPVKASVLDRAAVVADRLTASCRSLAKVMQERYRKEVTVIDECAEGEELAPCFAREERLKIGWFGHRANMEGFIRLAPKLVSRAEVRFASNTAHTVEGAAGAPWSRAVEAQLLAWADVIVIPISAPGNRPNPATKSASRVIRATQAGKFVLAEPIDSYQAFSEWHWIGDIIDGLDWLEGQDREAIESRIGQAQAYLRRKHAPEVVATQWQRVCQSLS
jgi:hypothetical protein